MSQTRGTPQGEMLNNHSIDQVPTENNPTKLQYHQVFIEFTDSMNTLFLYSFQTVESINSMNTKYLVGH